MSQATTPTVATTGTCSLQDIWFSPDDSNESGPYTVYFDNIVNGSPLYTWEGDITGNSALINQPSFAGTGNTTIYTSPAELNQCLCVNSNMDVGTRCQRMDWQWQLPGPNAIRGVLKNNLTISLNKPITIRVLVVPQTLPNSISSAALSLSQPANTSVVAGHTATFSVTATTNVGGGTLSYQWKKNGTNISSATDSSYSIPAVVSGDAGSYTCAVTLDTPAASSVTMPATLTFLDPGFTTQPVNTTVPASSNATYTVVADGSGSLTYQWKKQGTTTFTNLVESGHYVGTTTPSLTIVNCQAADRTNYQCVVTGSAGSATSSTVALGVSPTITSQPASVTAGAGTTVHYDVTANGQITLTYQWQKGGVNLSNGGNVAGATSAHLTLSGVQLTDVGSYTCGVTNGVGGVLTTAATLTVLDPSINTQPISQTITYGGSTNLSIVAGGGTAFTYQWYKGVTPLSDGGHITGSTAASLTVSTADFSDDADYHATATDGNGTATSSNAHLTVRDPYIATPPSNVQVGEGTNAVFTVSAGGTIVNYQWKKGGIGLSNGAHISGANSASLTIISALVGDNDTYSVVASGVGPSETASATLQVFVTPTIATQPASSTVNAGTVASFSVVANGTAPLSYQWKKLVNGTPTDINNGANISGATSATLYLTNVVNADATNYLVVVTNVAGSVTSDGIAKLTVIDPAVNGQPVSLTRNSGTTAIFTVNVGGTQPITYSWKKNGSPLADGPTGSGSTVSGASTTSLTITGLSASDGGNYDVSGGNSVGIYSSSAATLTVNDPAINSQPIASQTLNAGQTATMTVGAFGSGTITYQWKKNGVSLADGPAAGGGVITGSTAATLSISNLRLADASSYTVVVSGSGPSVTSSNSVLNVIDPIISSQPSSTSVGAGTNAIFTVVAIGTSPTYQWKKGGVDLSNDSHVVGATTASLTLVSSSQADAASYSVVVSGVGAPVTSANAVLTVVDPPSITTQPPAATTRTGAANHTIAVVATGTAPLTYHWRKNGVNLTDSVHAGSATVTNTATATLGLNGVQLSDAGSYDCVISNPAGTVTSSAQVLSLQFTVAAVAAGLPSGSVTIVRSPSASTVAANTSITITATLNKPNFAFNGWTGTATSAGTIAQIDTNLTSITFTLTNNTSLTANYLSTVSDLILDNDDPTNHVGNNMVTFLPSGY